MYKPNFKGFAVGNGVTDWKYDTFPAFIEMAYWHGLYDDDLYNSIKENQCDFSYFEFNSQNLSDACMAIVNRFHSLVQDLNVYDVFGKCWKNQTTSVFRLHDSHQFLQADDGLSTYKTFMTAEEYTPWVKIPKFNVGGKKLGDGDESPCVY